VTTDHVWMLYGIDLGGGGEKESEVGHGMKVVWVGVDWMMMRVGWVVECSVMVRKHMYGIKCGDLWS
jgi:hypothetical protein